MFRNTFSSHNLYKYKMGFHHSLCYLFPFFSFFLIDFCGRCSAKSVNVASPATAPPPFPYAAESEAIEDFRRYMPFAYAVGKCNSTWIDQIFPKGSNFEINHPSTLVRGLFDPSSQATVNVIYNDYLESIIVSFRPTLTKQQVVDDLKIWRSEPFSLSPSNILEFFKNMMVDSRIDTSSSPFSKPKSGSTTARLRDERTAHGGVEESSDNDPTLQKPTSTEFIIPKDAYLHHGFQTQYNVFRNDTLLLTSMLARRFPHYKIVFTGHSLGGAIAQIAAVDFSMQVSADVSERIWLFPFASPRVGNQVWVDFVNHQPFAKLGHIQRLVRFGDPVPNLPPRLFGYMHPFQEHVVWSNLSITRCPEKKRHWWMDLISSPTPALGSVGAECLTNSPFPTEYQMNLHPPRLYLSYLGLQFNCSASVHPDEE